jgi:hypothetical protein
MSRVGVFAVLAFLFGVRNVVAQEDRFYVGVSGLVSTQATGQGPGEDPDLPRTAVGGTAFGVVGEVGAFLVPRLSVSLEASVPARFESVQETDYLDVFRTDSRHRDVAFSALVHLHAAPLGPVQLAFVAGPSFVHEDTLQRTAFQVSAPGAQTGPFGPYGPETSLSRWTVGATLGADVAVRVSRRIQVVPQIRLHVVPRATASAFDEQDSFRLGLSTFVLRPAVGVRVGF